MNTVKVQKSVAGGGKLTVVVSASLFMWTFSLFAGDVFSDAAVWHRGFVGTEGAFTSGSKTQFPDALRLGDADNSYHSVTKQGTVNLRTETVDYPYASISREELVAYFPQTVSADNKLQSGMLSMTSPFAFANANQYTAFVRFRWDGTTPDNYTALLLGCGYTYGNNAGIRFGFRSDGQWAYGRGQDTETYLSFTPYAISNVWTDCAIVVSNMNLTLYVFNTNCTGIASKTFALGDNMGGIGMNDDIRLGSSQGANSAQADQMYKKALRGSIHSFACWPRALSPNEVRQVFAWPSADLVRLGTVNGSSLEFAGGESAATDANATTDWSAMPAALTAANPSLSISFNVPAQDAGIGQLLRVSGASGSCGSLAVSLNGAALGTVKVKSGQTGVIGLPRELLAAGGNTLVLSRTDADFAFDAIAVGGGFQIGIRDSDRTEFSIQNASYQSWYATEPNWKHVQGVVIIPKSNGYSHTDMHVFIPKEIAGDERVTLTVGTRMQFSRDGAAGAGMDQPFSIFVNGAETAAASLTIPANKEKTWYDFSAVVSAADLLAGDNVFSFQNMNVEGTAYQGWADFDYFRVDARFKEKRGFIMSFR